MRLDLIQARQFSVLLAHFLTTPREGGETSETHARELGIDVTDYDELIHWPRLCARRALTAMRVVESEIALTNWEQGRGL